MPTTPTGACPFPFNFLFSLCFRERAWPGGRLDCRCLSQAPGELSSQLPSACKTSHNPTQTLDGGQPAFIKHLLNAPRLLLAREAGAPSSGLNC